MHAAAPAVVVVVVAAPNKSHVSPGVFAFVLMRSWQHMCGMWHVASTYLHMLHAYECVVVVARLLIKLCQR